MAKYERVIFLDGDNANESIAIFNREFGGGEEGLLQYLSQWHNPGEHETASEPSHGSSDTVYQIGDYFLSINESLNYVGLDYRI